MPHRMSSYSGLSRGRDYPRFEVRWTSPFLLALWVLGAGALVSEAWGCTPPPDNSDGCTLVLGQGGRGPGGEVGLGVPMPNPFLIARACSTHPAFEPPL